MTMQITCPPCPMCGQMAELSISEEGYHRWAKLGQLVQTAFPQMSDSEREMLITGTHPECWIRMFASQEEEWPECEGCKKYEQFLADPMTEALGVGSEMAPLFKHTCSND